MANHSFAFVGHGNIVGSGLTNVGNTVNIYQPERRVLSLDSCVSFDALLNSDARYPAPKCHQDTRKRAQDVVKGWLCRKGEGWEKGIMWMSGAPGVGKSAVVQTSCEDLAGDDVPESSMSDAESSNHDVDGCFFFTRGVESRANMIFFPATIAYQLARSRASCQVIIDKTIAQDPHVLKAHFPSQFRRLLLLPAKHLDPLERPITIAIDGLDECANVPDQVELLKLILEAVKTTRMRFLIASRPEQHIHAFFRRGDVSQHTLHVRLDEETFNTSQDIKIFLREEFARIRRERPEACPGKLSNGEDWPGERVLDHLTLESDSQFMIPTLAIGFIDTPLFPPDKQLRILMEAPPSRAFSALDTLYHKILSRRPPPEQLRLHGEDDLREYQDVLMGILRVIIAWSGKPLSAAQIATFLDKPVEVVQMIVRGSMRTLFEFHTPELDSPITLCHKSLRDYLLDQKRSEQYFIPSPEEDNLFVALLTRPASFFPLHPSSAEVLMDVLAAILWIYRKWSVPQFATLLDVDPAIVERLVISGPTSVLFDAGDDTIHVCTFLFNTFLQDPDRSGALFIPESRTVTLLLRFLSRFTQLSLPHTYSQTFLIDILAVAMDNTTLTPADIATLLEVNTRVIEHVVQFAESKIVFDITGGVTLSSEHLRSLLQDPHRSGEFFVSETRLDPVFSRMLSQQPLSYPLASSYHDMLMGIMTVIVAFEGSLGVERIASVLDVDDTLVRGVVEFGPAKPLFRVTEDGVKFSITSFSGGYLAKPARSGVFFISDTKIDALLIRLLSRHPVFPPSNPCSQSVLVDVLAAVFWMEGSPPTVAQIAALLKVDCSLVEHVVKIGAVKWLFEVGKDGKVEVVSQRIEHFLRNVDRCRGFFVSETRLDRIFIHTLTNQGPPYPLRSYYHDILMGVLAVVVAFRESLGIKRVASVLEVDDTLVEEVVMLAPTKVLFRVWESGNIRFSTSLMETFLRDATRAGAFFLSQSKIDALFIRILSRVPVPGAAHSHSRDLLMDVLTTVICCHPSPSISQISILLGCPDSSLVEGIVLGPTKDLFRSDSNGIRLSVSSLESFLKDVNRSGEFCITEKRIDALFTRALSRQPPSDPSLSYSRSLLMDVLTVVASFSHWSTVPRIASALEVKPQDIEHIVLGPLQPLFDGGLNMTQPGRPFINFLMDAERSGEFFISSERIGALFTRILSRQPPSHPSYSYSRDVLMGALAVIADCTDITVDKVAWDATRIATFLDVSPALIEGVLYVGSSRLHFCSGWAGIVFSSPLLESFLKDSSRSGEFFISDRSLDPHFSRILISLRPVTGGESPHSRDILKDVLAITLVLPKGMSMPVNAAALDLDPSHVESVVRLGLSRSLFVRSAWSNGLVSYPFSTASIVPFLRDAERSGDFYISDAAIDALFIRILSLPPPSHLSDPPSKDVLRGVMAVVLASQEPLTVPKIAALLHVDRSLVEAVVNIIPANVLFYVQWDTLKVTISAPLLIPFLHDARRSGEFFISPTMTLDEIPKPWLSNQPETEASFDETQEEALEFEVGDSDGLTKERKRKLSLLAPSRNGSRDSGSQATGSTGPKRPRGGGQRILEEGAQLSEAVYSMDVGGFEEDTVWSEDKIWAEWVVDLDSPSEENTVPTEESEFCAGGLDRLQASTLDRLGAYDSGVSESIPDEI